MVQQVRLVTPGRNVAAANNLLRSSAAGVGQAGQNFADILTGVGERKFKTKGDKIGNQLASLQNLDSLDADAAAILAQYKPGSYDAATAREALSARREGLIAGDASQYERGRRGIVDRNTDRASNDSHFSALDSRVAAKDALATNVVNRRVNTSNANRVDQVIAEATKANTQAQIVRDEDNRLLGQEANLRAIQSGLSKFITIDDAGTVIPDRAGLQQMINAINDDGDTTNDVDPAAVRAAFADQLAQSTNYGIQTARATTQQEAQDTIALSGFKSREAANKVSATEFAQFQDQNSAFNRDLQAWFWDPDTDYEQGQQVNAIKAAFIGKIPVAEIQAIAVANRNEDDKINLRDFQAALDKRALPALQNESIVQRATESLLGTGQ